MADKPPFCVRLVPMPDKPTRIVETDTWIYYMNETPDIEEYCYFMISKNALKEWNKDE